MPFHSSFLVAVAAVLLGCASNAGSSSAQPAEPEPVAPAPAPEPGNAARDCESGEKADHCFERGLKLQRGDGVRKDRKTAQALFVSSCEQGSNLGCNSAGWGFVKGDGTAKDAAQAGRYFERACPTGNEHAIGCNSRGFALLTGLGDTPREPEKAVEILMNSCRGANGYACMTLNMGKSLGLALPLPIPRPNLACQQSIEQLEGFCKVHRAAQECWLAAMMLTTGTCTEINRDRAKPLHTKAHTQGAIWPDNKP